MGNIVAMDLNIDSAAVTSSRNQVHKTMRKRYALASIEL
jgi:hypothetical protein